MRYVHLALSCLLAFALHAQPDTRVATHLEAFFKALTTTTDYRLEVEVAHGKGTAPATANVQKGLVVRRGNDLYSDLMGRRTVLTKGHFLVIDNELRTIFHQMDRTGRAPRESASWTELQEQVRSNTDKFRIIASDAKTITLSQESQEEGVGRMELILGRADHLPVRVIYRLKAPLEDGNDRIEVAYRFLPPDPRSANEHLSLGHYLRTRADGTYEVAPAFKSYRLIEPDRS